MLSWLRPSAPHRVVVRYDDLIRAPKSESDRVMAVVAPGMRPDPAAVIPGFGELREVDPAFFRRGTTGTHRDELPPSLHDLFWSRPGNREAMELSAG